MGTRKPKERTFTEDEIKAQISRYTSSYAIELVAQDFIKGMLDNRDPDLDPGEVVIDDDDFLWQYDIGEREGTYCFSAFGDTTAYPLDAPNRPIKRVNISTLRQAVESQ